MNGLRFLFYALAAFIVVDGDTIKAPYGVTYRLLGYDTPETRFAKCDAERELGLAAKDRLEELLSIGEVRVIESGKLDKYGRTLAKVTVNGRDVGDILIGEGSRGPIMADVASAGAAEAEESRIWRSFPIPVPSLRGGEADEAIQP